ncbi:uncharacterized protein LOC100898851 [Galendromus occidentalis]|uniref:Uncharacterized protein LOC100898851 n=1 Tax=Galendromus occidentalis TaxID=34638 RepID=A0AAJ6QUT4_9ACAR|nr:uncharacterized protein LOC100898851 [Galendromus occidentalis]
MVENKKALASRPPKKEGIEVHMYPLNPDGSWKDGVPPPRVLPKTPLKTRSSTKIHAQLSGNVSFSSAFASRSSNAYHIGDDALRKVVLERLIRTRLERGHTDFPVIIYADSEFSEFTDEDEESDGIEDADIKRDD